ATSSISTASVRRFVEKRRRPRPPEADPGIVTTPGEEGQVDYGTEPMVCHPDPQVPPHSPLRLHLGLQPQERPALALQVQHAPLGRAARGSVSPVGRRSRSLSSIICARRSSSRTSTIPP